MKFYGNEQDRCPNVETQQAASLSKISYQFKNQPGLILAEQLAYLSRCCSTAHAGKKLLREVKG